MFFIRSSAMQKESIFSEQKMGDRAKSKKNNNQGSKQHCFFDYRRKN